MAKKQTLGWTDEPVRLTDYKRAQLCRQWAELEDQRLELQSQMYERRKLCEAIERELAEQLDLDGVVAVDLPRFEFGRELVKGTMYYKAALIEELGLEEFERRQAALPLREKFYLREKLPPKKTPRRRAA